MPHLDPARFEATLIRTPLGNDQFPVCLSWSKDAIRRWARKHGRNIFELNDLVAEWRGLVHWLTKGSNVIHFLDGEHSLFALPYLDWIACKVGNPTVFLATFHQPPNILKKVISPTVTSGLHQTLTVADTQNSFFDAPGARKADTILHGVDTDFFKPGSDSRRKPFTLLTVGRWLRDIDAILATAQAMHSDPGIEFHLVSPGIELNGLPSNVRVSTDISDETLRKLYQESSLLLLPLKDSTANNVLLEAAASGLPILSTDLTSIRTYLPGDEAWLVKGNSPQELLVAISTLRNNPERLNRMKELGRQRALSLSWNKIAVHFENTYDAVWQRVHENRRTGSI